MMRGRDQKTQDAQTRNFYGLDDPLEQTQRLPVLNNTCNCPSENMIVHVVGCPLREEQFKFRVHGRPLSDIGLEGANVVHPDGRVEPLIGIYFHRWNDELPLYENLRLAFAHQYPGCSLVFGPL